MDYVEIDLSQLVDLSEGDSVVLPCKRCGTNRSMMSVIQITGNKLELVPNVLQGVLVELPDT